MDKLSIKNINEKNMERSMDKFVEKPFLPSGKVSMAIVDSRMGDGQKRQLKANSIDLIEVGPCYDLYEAISCHPDIQCHPLGGNRIVIAPNASQSLKDHLIHQKFELVVGNTTLEGNYPNNIAYNVARIGDVAFHNTACTDPVLKHELIKQGVKLVHVNQGYTKCSVAIVSERALVTADKGIAAAARDNGLDALLIRPGFISLKGLSYGFIGGTCGLTGPEEITFIGDITKHPDFSLISRFVIKHGKRIVFLEGAELSDFGSMIPVKEAM